MLVTFSIDPEAMPMADTAPGPRRHIHERLIDKWLTWGVLVFAGPSRDQSAIIATINMLPQDLRKIWKSALRVGRAKAGPVGWEGLDKVESLNELRQVAGTIQLACLDTVRYCAALGLEETSDETCRTLDAPSIEVARFDCADRAQSFLQAEALGGIGIPEGQSIHHVWFQRFAPLATSSQHVTIVDPYCLQDGEGINGLARFILELNRTARSASLLIYAACHLDGSIERTDDLVAKVQAISGQVGPGCLRSIEIKLIPNRYFRKDSHGRYIRFDSHAVEIDLGAALFYGDAAGNTWRRCQFTFKRASSFHEDVERDLRTHSEPGSPWFVR